MSLQGSVRITDADITDGVMTYYSGHIVSFEAVTLPLTYEYDIGSGDFAFAETGTKTDIEYTWDKVFADSIILTNGDDSFPVFEGWWIPQMYGLGGGDSLGSSVFNPGSYMDGGDGNDILSGDSGGRDTMIGGNGDDTFYIAGPDKVTGGAGADTFIFGGGY